MTACVKEISVSQVLYAKFQIEEHFALLQTFTINIKFCAPSNVLFSCKLLVGRQPPFLEWLCIVIILKSDWSTLSRWPAYGSRTVNTLWHILVNQMASKIQLPLTCIFRLCHSLYRPFRKQKGFLQRVQEPTSVGCNWLILIHVVYFISW